MWLSVLLAMAGTAPASAAFLGANPRLGESLLNAGIEQFAGDAEVLSIGPCPEVAARPSPRHRLVTGTFLHASADVLDLAVEGLDEPIGTTAVHLFWSVDRGDFVPAAELRAGEWLRTAEGEVRRVISSVARGTPEPVYNLEVDGQHVYYVSTSHLLVHNTKLGIGETIKPFSGQGKPIEIPSALPPREPRVDDLNLRMRTAKAPDPKIASELSPEYLRLKAQRGIPDNIMNMAKSRPPARGVDITPRRSARPGLPMSMEDAIGEVRGGGDVTARGRDAARRGMDRRFGTHRTGRGRSRTSIQQSVASARLATFSIEEATP